MVTKGAVHTTKDGKFSYPMLFSELKIRKAHANMNRSGALTI